jgi:hypothetical protein
MDFWFVQKKWVRAGGFGYFILGATLKTGISKGRLNRIHFTFCGFVFSLPPSLPLDFFET